jgi:hypothetical protein
MNKRWAVLKSNYVIDVVIWDGISSWYYIGEYDSIVEDKYSVAGWGDWYESSEEIFYKPLSTPPDFPPQ